ncbi:lymphocyte-specific protein 1 isoform X1 [Ambystoma mexicanum]|uniref:lymphocyte-specific protein 1 isoform X1 n=1 Tax=Ambystoma mexicanum TaxID=8296 RepID=UPI0037E79519
MADNEEMPEEQNIGEEARLTAQWSVEDEEEAARERRRRERERQGQSQEDESLPSPAVENGVSNVLDNRCDFKPLGSSELEEDEGFSDWSLKLEQRKQRSAAQEAAGVSTMSGRLEDAPHGGQDQQNLGFKAFGGGFAALRIGTSCEFQPSDRFQDHKDESPEEGVEDMQSRMKMSPSSGLSPVSNEEDNAGLREAEALLGMGSLSQEDEESRDLERTIQREAELEALKQEARRRQQQEEEEERQRENELRQEEQQRQREEEELRWQEEERRRQEEHYLREQEERRQEEEKQRAFEEAQKQKAEEEELERRRLEVADRRPKTLSHSGSEDESNRPLSPMSPTVKILDRTESLNRSIKKSNSVKKSQPALPISKIDDRLEQYTHAIESSTKNKLSRQPSIELISTVEAVANKKTLFETGDVSSPGKVQSCKDTEGLNVGISDLINQFAKGTPPPKSGNSTSNKKYKFILTGHGKYEKVYLDDNEDQ